jgi:orotate phosphoribosyltransferase
MRDSDFQNMLAETKSLLSGHFQLSSGLHSGQYLQCALLLSRPDYSAILCQELADAYDNDKIDIVIGPAYGGIIVAYELARALKARAIFTERKEGVMQLRRGFAINKAERVLIAEDVITTGKSVKEVITAISPYEPDIVGIASLIDRTQGQDIFNGLTFKSLKRVDIKNYTQETCPLCRENIPVTKPGSRAVTSH